MPKSPAKPIASKEELATLRSSILKRPPSWIFDPIDMEHVLQNDPALGKQLLAQRLDTHAEVHQAVANGAAKAAKILK